MVGDTGLVNRFTKVVRLRLEPSMLKIRNTGLVNGFTKVVRLCLESRLLKIGDTGLVNGFTKVVGLRLEPSMLKVRRMGLVNGFTKVVGLRLEPSMLKIRNTGLVNGFTKVVRLCLESRLLKIGDTGLVNGFTKVVRLRLEPSMLKVRCTGLMNSLTKVVRLILEPSMLKIRNTGLLNRFTKDITGGIWSRTEYVEDRKHGTSERFYESGGIRTRTEYVEDRKCGPHKMYSPKGDLILDIALEDGVQISIKDSLNVVNLDKVTDFLDKLPPEKFDFAEIRSECGSKACVVGWFPNIFPEVEYTKGRFRLSSMDGLEHIKVASYMLNVSEKIARDLFSPQDEISKLFPTLPVCGGEATPKEVSAKLKAFKELVTVA